MSIAFAVNEHRPTKGLYIYHPFQSDDVNLHSRSIVRLKLDKALTCSVIVISLTIFQLDLCMAYIYNAHAHLDELRSQWLIGRGQKSTLNYLDNCMSKQ